MSKKSSSTNQLKIRVTADPVAVRINFAEPATAPDCGPSTSRGPESKNLGTKKKVVMSSSRNAGSTPQSSRSTSPAGIKRVRLAASAIPRSNRVYSAQRKRGKSIRQTLRESVLESNREGLRRSVRELEELRQKAEEKSECRKIKIGELNMRLREKESELNRYKRRIKTMKGKMRSATRENQSGIKEINDLKVKLDGANKKAEKAELARAKAESKKTAENGGQEAFFQDILRNFNEMLEANLQCSICNEIYIFAATVSCGHSFCEECIDEWKEKSQHGRPNCPICRSDITSQSANLAMDHYIEKTVENFFPEAAKSTRAELVEQRKAQKVVRKAEADRSSEAGPRGLLFARIIAANEPDTDSDDSSIIPELHFGNRQSASADSDPSDVVWPESEESDEDDLIFTARHPNSPQPIMDRPQAQAENVFYDVEQNDSDSEYESVADDDDDVDNESAVIDLNDQNAEAVFNVSIDTDVYDQDDYGTAEFSSESSDFLEDSDIPDVDSDWD